MNMLARYHRICRYTIFLSLLLIIIQTPPLSIVDTSQTEHDAILNIVNLRLELDETWSDDVYLTRYAPHNITSSIYPTDPIIEETIVYVSLLSDENSIIISHRGDSPWQEGEFLPMTELYTVEVKNNGQLEEVFVNVSIVQTGPAETPTPIESNWLTGAVILVLFVTVVPLVVLALSIAYYRKRIL